ARLYQLRKIVQRAQINPVEAYSSMVKRKHHAPEFFPGIVEGDQHRRAGMKELFGLHLCSHDCGTAAEVQSKILFTTQPRGSHLINAASVFARAKAPLTLCCDTGINARSSTKSAKAHLTVALGT